MACCLRGVGWRRGLPVFLFRLRTGDICDVVYLWFWVFAAGLVVGCGWRVGLVVDKGCYDT